MKFRRKFSLFLGKNIFLGNWGRGKISYIGQIFTHGNITRVAPDIRPKEIMLFYIKKILILPKTTPPPELFSFFLNPDFCHFRKLALSLSTSPVLLSILSSSEEEIFRSGYSNTLTGTWRSNWSLGHISARLISSPKWRSLGPGSQISRAV